MSFIWYKPVIIFYRERVAEPERKAFLIVKARRLETKEGAVDRYVLCWFDDEEDDFTKSWRRLTGVTFQNGISFGVNSMNKKTCDANFKAEKGKLN